MENVRFQFELPVKQAIEIEAMMTECGIETKKEFFNNALTLLKWALRETKRGHAIAAFDEKADKFQTIHMPILDRVAPAEETEIVAAQ